MKLKDILVALVGIIISFSLIYLTFSNIDKKIFLSYLNHINVYYLLLFVLSTFFEILFRSIKWYLILLPIVKTKLWKIFKFEVIALGINNLLPFRMGELSKIFMISQNYNIPKTIVLSTVFIERLLDTIMLFLIFISYSLAGETNLPIIRKEVGLVIIFSILTFIYFFFVFSEKLIARSKKFNELQQKHPKIYSLITKIQNGGTCFRYPKLTLLIIFVGIVQWNFDVLNNYIVAKSLSIEEIKISKAAMTVVAGSLSASIPSMPGYFGNYEYTISRICIMWGVEKELATLFPTLIHILSYILITTAAILFLYTEGIKIKNILTSKKEG